MESPSKSLELRFARFAPKIWQKLAEISRTGWVKRGILEPETVQEHIISLLKLISTFSHLDENKKREIREMLEVHDWPEALVGDIVTYSNDPEERKRLLKEKEMLERDAMKKICEAIGEEGGTIFALWERFENSMDDLAVFARELDKYQAVEKAAEYQTIHNIPILDEFRNYAIQFIKNPIILERMKKLR